MATTVNNIATFNVPLKSGTQTIFGISGQTNQLTFDSLNPTGTTSAVISEFIQNSDGTLTFTLFDYLNNIKGVARYSCHGSA